MARITMAGPSPASPLVARLETLLRNLDHRVRVHIGDSAGLAASEGWAETDILVVAAAPCDGAAIGAGRALRAILSPIVGLDGVDVEAATAAGVLIANGRAPQNADSMAEAAIMMMLAAAYDLPGSMALMRSPERRRPLPSLLSGKTIGIIGYGAISRGVIARLAGWNLTILVHTETPDDAGPPVRFAPLADLIRQSDIVLVLTGLSPRTRRLLGPEQLSWIKPTAILVNLARGGIVDDDALTERLRDGQLRYAALDVFEVEPLPHGSPLRDLNNVILTPHCAGHTIDSVMAAQTILVRNIDAVLAGELPLNTLNPQIFDRWRARWATALA